MSAKRWLWIAALLGALLLGLSALLLLVALPRYVEGKVMSTAAANGVALEAEQIGFGWGWVQLTQVKVRLDRVRSVQMQVGRIDVSLSGLSPQAIELDNVEGLVTGSITNVGLELSEWTKDHPQAYALPLSARNVHAEFVDPAGTPPWLEVSKGELTRTRTGGVFAAQQARFVGVDLGKVAAGFSRDASNIALGFGEADLGRAPFRVEVAASGKIPTATFALAPTPAEKLARPLGIPLPIPGVIVSSVTSIAFAEGASAGAISGTAQVTLKNYVPPHPFELDGFIFGDTTQFETKFALPPIRDRITFSESRLTAGRFELRGDGLLTRSPDHSEITMTLKGELPCSALAAAEANSRLAKILSSSLRVQASQWAAKLVGGSVAISLKLSADTRNLLQAHLERTIGVGCGLHPLSLAELAKLVPSPSELAELLKSLPALPSDLSNLPNLPVLPSGLPSLPSGMPALPALPTLPGLSLPNPAPTASAKATPRNAKTSQAAPKPASS